MSQAKDIIDGIKHRIKDRADVYSVLNRAVRMVSQRLFFHQAAMKGGGHWERPAELAKPSDIMPFYGVFDDVVQGAMINYYLGKESEAVNEISLMQDYIHKAVDELVPSIEAREPQRFVDNAQFDSLSNEEWA